MQIVVRTKQVTDGRYLAECPALPGCQGQGSSPEEAKQSISEAIHGYVAAISNFVPDHVDCQPAEAWAS